MRNKYKSIVHNKKRILLLNLLINCISARSASQILCIKVHYTFRFSNFLIIALCNSSANCRQRSEITNSFILYHVLTC